LEQVILTTKHSSKNRPRGAENKREYGLFDANPGVTSSFRQKKPIIPVNLCYNSPIAALGLRRCLRGFPVVFGLPRTSFT